MRILPLLYLLGACAADGGPPTECAPDLALLGSPGVVDNQRQFHVSGGDVVELCARLDSSANTGDVTFTARLTFSPFPLALTTLDNKPLAQGAGRLEFSMPSGDVLYAILAFEVPKSIASTTANLALDFAEPQ